MATSTTPGITSRMYLYYIILYILYYIILYYIIYNGNIDHAWAYLQNVCVYCNNDFVLCYVLYIYIYIYIYIYRDCVQHGCCVAVYSLCRRRAVSCCVAPLRILHHVTSYCIVCKYASWVIMYYFRSFLVTVNCIQYCIICNVYLHISL